MAAHAPRLARLFTPTYVSKINAQLVSPAGSVLVKPNELHSALDRPLQVAHYEPDRSALYLAATLSYGLIQGHPFLDGNKRTAFFVANEYIRAHGQPGFADGGNVRDADVDVEQIVTNHVDVAKGQLDVAGLVDRASSQS